MKITFDSSEEAFQYFANRIGDLHARLQLLEAKNMGLQSAVGTLAEYLSQLGFVDRDGLDRIAEDVAARIRSITIPDGEGVIAAAAEAVRAALLSHADLPDPGRAFSIIKGGRDE